MVRRGYLPALYVQEADLHKIQLAPVIAFCGFNKIIRAHLRVPRSQKKKASSRREQAAHIFCALYQTYVRVRDQVFGSTPFLFKYCPVVLEVKIEEPPYPLHRLYPSTAVLL